MAGERKEGLPGAPFAQAKPGVAERPAGTGAPGAAVASRNEATATSIFSMTAPALDEDLSAFPKTPERLLAVLKDKLAKCRVLVNDSGILCEADEDGLMIRYKNLPNNLQGAWMLKIGDIQFMTGRTRTTWILVYDRPPESLPEDPRFTGKINFMNRDIIMLESGKTMFVSRISRDERNALNIIAAGEAARTAAGATAGKAAEGGAGAGPGQYPPEAAMAPAAANAPLGRPGRAPGLSLEPDETGTVDYEAIQSALKSVQGFHSSDPFFELGAFADSIKFITTEQDADGRDRYYIVAGEEESIYWLYVNRAAPEPQGTALTARFTHGTERCILYKEGSA